VKKLTPAAIIMILLTGIETLSERFFDLKNALIIHVKKAFVLKIILTHFIIKIVENILLIDLNL
jgi:hypothetical protein